MTEEMIMKAYFVEALGKALKLDSRHPNVMLHYEAFYDGNSLVYEFIVNRKKDGSVLNCMNVTADSCYAILCDAPKIAYGNNYSGIDEFLHIEAQYRKETLENQTKILKEEK